MSYWRWTGHQKWSSRKSQPVRLDPNIDKKNRLTDLQWQKGMVGAMLIYVGGMGAALALGGAVAASGVITPQLSRLERAGWGTVGAGGAAMAVLCGWAFVKATRQIDEQIAALPADQ